MKMRMGFSALTVACVGVLGFVLGSAMHDGSPRVALASSAAMAQAPMTASCASSFLARTRMTPNIGARAWR